MTYFDNPLMLWSPSEWLYFCPSFQYSREQNVNALMLLVLYVGIFLTLYRRDGKYLLYAILFVALLAIGNRYYESKHSNKNSSKRGDRSKKVSSSKTETFEEETKKQINPSKVGVDFQVDDSFYKSRTYVPRKLLSEADQTAFAKSLFEHNSR